ncbi:MAG: hypothetical protein WED87_03560, partial [Dehalococcoidia bacterium]
FLRLPATVERLADRMDQLALRMDQLTQRLDQFAAETQTNFDRLDGRVGNIEGRQYESDYRQNLASHLAEWFEGVRLAIPGNVPELTAALRSGRFSQRQWRSLIALDVLARVNPPVASRSADYFIAIELSKVVDLSDVDRAAERAELIKLAGLEAVAAVDGLAILPEALAAAEARGVMSLVYRGSAA